VSLEGRTLGIYEIGRELGRGGMGAVYAATTTADSPAGPAGTTVAIKHIHAHLVEDSGAFARFVREADVGKSIRHEHVVRTFELCEEQADGEACHFMVMEFIKGQTLKELLAELGTVPEHLLYQVADQALDALAEIHSRGIVHRDIKPENIVITAEHHVLLMDLGVARLVEKGKTMTQAGEFVGSLPYAAPEQFGVEDSIGPAADLYAFGAVLYELITGRCPFDASELGMLLQQKLQGEVAPPSHVAEEVDAFLDEVILTCLQRESVRRFGSAGELRQILAEGRQSRWWRGRSVGRLPGAELALKRLRLAREVPLVGRAGELGRFHAVFEEAALAGRVLMVGGAAGVGKSRVVYDFLESLGSAGGPLVLAGRAVGPGGRAYQAFLEVIHDLVGFGDLPVDGRREALEEQLAKLLPDTPGIVPHLAEFLLAGLKPDDAAGFTKDALLSSFANLLRSAATKRPVIVAIEDLQLAGDGTLELFQYLARCVPGHAILLVGVYRDDEVEQGSTLHALLDALAPREDVASLHVTPLDRNASDALVRAYTLNESAVRSVGNLLYERGEGSPHVVLEILAHLRASGALVERDEQLFVEGPTQAIQLPSSITDVFALKLGRLDEEQRETLEAAAVLGPEFSASLLAGVLEERRIKLLKRLALLERKHRLLASSGKDSFRFVKRQVQESIYQSISPALRTEYHALVAETLRERYDEATTSSHDEATTSSVEEEQQAAPPEMAFELTRHLVAADQALEAEPYLGPALDHLAGAYHATFATPFLERIEREFEPARPPARFAIATHLWSLYEAQGQLHGQQRILDHALQFAEAMGDKEKEAEVCCRMAATHWRIGDQERARADAERGVSLARESGNRRWEAGSLQALGATDWSRGDFHACYERWVEALAIRREIGDRHGVGKSLQALGAVMARLGKPAQEIYETRLEALEIFRESGDRVAECGQLLNVGNSLAQFGRHEEALEHFNQAADLCRELGNVKMEAFPFFNGARSHFALGRYERALEHLERAVEILAEVKNRDMQIAALTEFGARLTEVGEFDKAITRIDAAVRIAHETNARHRLGQALAALGNAYHSRGEHQRGWHYFEQALELAKQMGIAAAHAEILAVLGAAALREGDDARAATLLVEELEVSENAELSAYQRPLAWARLARSCEENRDTHAREAAEALAGGDGWPLVVTAEIHSHLAEVLDDPDHLRRAKEDIQRITREFRNDSYRDHVRSSCGIDLS